MTALRAFLSYRSEDRAARVEFEMRGLAGMACGFVDIPVTSGPVDWRRRYQEMIADVVGVIVLVGPSTAASEPVRWEIGEATRIGKPVMAVRIHSRPHRIPEGVPEESVFAWERGPILKELASWLRTTTPTSTTATTISTGMPV